MPVFLDARIPVVFGVEPGPSDAVFTAVGGTLHPAACACCLPRGPDAAGLDRLFLQRVRGEVPWFTRIVVLGHGESLRRAITADSLLSARFRIG